MSITFLLLVLTFKRCVILVSYRVVKCVYFPLVIPTAVRGRMNCFTLYVRYDTSSTLWRNPGSTSRARRNPPHLDWPGKIPQCDVKSRSATSRARRNPPHLHWPGEVSSCDRGEIRPHLHWPGKIRQCDV
uniref:Secreted protein n=1 Tax=Heterorhabditis bacteriophora TaxID=37862 RepID=A0A1I7WKL8_HETBA